MKWKDRVDAVLYINLDDRQDRRRQIKDLLLKKLGLPSSMVRRVPAVKDSPGFKGCTLSHMKALQIAIEEKMEFVCLVEDDLMLHTPGPDFHRRLNEAWEKLQEDFDVIYLSMTPIDLEEQDHPGSGFHRVRQALGMPGLVVHHRYFQKLMSIYQSALKEGKPHDLVTQLHQPTDHWYGFFPQLARQRPGFSDIENKTNNYAYLDIEGSMLKQKDLLERVKNAVPPLAPGKYNIRFPFMRGRLNFQVPPP